MAGPHLFEKYRTYAAWGQDQVMRPADSFDRPADELVEDRFIPGSPEECYEQLQPYLEQLAPTQLVFRTHWAGMPVETALSSMQLISDELTARTEVDGRRLGGVSARSQVSLSPIRRPDNRRR